MAGCAMLTASVFMPSKRRLCKDAADFGGQLLEGERLGDEIDAGVQHAAMDQGVACESRRKLSGVSASETELAG